MRRSPEHFDRGEGVATANPPGTASKRPKGRGGPIVGPIGPGQTRRQVESPNVPEMCTDEHQQQNLQRNPHPLSGGSVRRFAFGNHLGLRFGNRLGFGSCQGCGCRCRPCAGHEWHRVISLITLPERLRADPELSSPMMAVAMSRVRPRRFSAFRQPDLIPAHASKDIRLWRAVKPGTEPRQHVPTGAGKAVLHVKARAPGSAIPQPSA